MSTFQNAVLSIRPARLRLSRKSILSIALYMTIKNALIAETSLSEV